MTLTSGSFGIFVTTSEGTFYSESAANPAGADHFLSYEGAGDKVTFPGPVTFISDIGHHYIAAEAGDDSDFADIVVQFESIHPNPEPGTLALVGTTCLIGAGIRARRRRKKAQAAA